VSAAGGCCSGVHWRISSRMTRGLPADMSMQLPASVGLARALCLVRRRESSKNSLDRMPNTPYRDVEGPD
jgi:hypothetical protein